MSPDARRSRQSTTFRYRGPARGGGPGSGLGRARAAHNLTRARLKRLRQGSILAIAIAGLFLLLWGTPADVPAQQMQSSRADTAAVQQTVDTTRADPGRSVEEATSTVRRFAVELTTLLPKILIAIVLLAAAGLIVRIVHAVLRRLLGEWERADAATALAGVIIWLIAFGVALSVVAGDTRALVGSVGLVGLALSWALQAPIESFAGWLLNSFKGYYRVGDRIAVGDVFGDVYRIDFLTTTVWEAGGPEKPVQGAQPTGALITFPNSEVLRTNVVNHTRMFPYVWDEIVIAVANESDLGYSMRVVASVAQEVIGAEMQGPVETYRALLEQEGLALDIADQPQVYTAPCESWTDITVRYLVGAHERRKWASALYLRVSEELAKPEHRARVQNGYPVQRVET